MQRNFIPKRCDKFIAKTYLCKPNVLLKNKNTMKTSEPYLSSSISIPPLFRLLLLPGDLSVWMCICIGCLWAMQAGYAQQGRLLTTDRELASSMVNQVYQDRHGIIWIATESGLTRCDGARTTTFKNDLNDPGSLKSNHTRCVFEDSRGRLWVGTLNGIMQHDRTTGKFIDTPQKDLGENELRGNTSAFVERRNGDVLAATSGHGIFRLEENGEEGPIWRQDTALTVGYYVNCLHEDSRGRLWVATEDRGLYALEAAGGRGPCLTKEEAGEVACLCEDDEGNIYAGSLRNGLWRCGKDGEGGFKRVDDGRTDACPDIRALHPDGKGGVLVGTDGNGVRRYDPHGKRIGESGLDVPGLDLRRAKVHSILTDRRGNTWLGCYQKGVAVVPDVACGFGYIGPRSSLRNSIGSCCVMSLCRDREGALWVGTDNDGIYRTRPDGTPGEHYPLAQEGEVALAVMCLCEDTQGRMWAGGYQKGLSWLDRRSGRWKDVRLPTADTDTPPSVYAIVEDERRHLWVGTMGEGLFRVDLETGEAARMPTFGRRESYTQRENRLPNRWVCCLLKTRKDGKLYIGTYDGLGCMDLETEDFVKPYGTNRLLPGQAVYALHEDDEGTIWIGTACGLLALHPQTRETRSYTTRDGLPDNSIAAIRSDREGRIWISTDSGMARMDKREGRFVCFYASDGLQGNEFVKGAAYQGARGDIAFGGTGGVTLFDPGEIKEPDRRPEIHVADIYVNNRPLRPGSRKEAERYIPAGGKEGRRELFDASRVCLAHNENSFGIELSAMEFCTPEHICFLYNLNGKGWVELPTGTSRISFSNQPPGSYHFQIKAKNHNACSDIRELTVVIAPPWYGTWWMKLAYVAAGGLLAGAVWLQVRHRYRMRREIEKHVRTEQLNEAKLQFFINIAHEIRTPMTLVISPLQKLMRGDGDDAERQKSYRIMHRNAERILSLINQLLDIRKIDKGQMRLRFRKTEVVGFMQDLCAAFEEQTRTKRISLEFRPDEKELEAWIDPKEFDKIVFNLLSNAFKYTPEGGAITVSLHRGEAAEEKEDAPLRRYFEVVVKDSGTGIDEKEKERIFDRFYQIDGSQDNADVGTGIGLHLTRSLVELHHGRIRTCNNTDGPGCSFIVRLPLGEEHLGGEEPEREETTAQRNAKPAAAPTTHAPAGAEKRVTRSRHRVLIVEDDEEIRRYVHDELGDSFHIEECDNGKEALDIVLKKVPDLVISDVMMPGMDGMTLCRKIRQNILVSHIPVIMLTARTRDEDNMEGLESGADAYITKPFNIEILRQTAASLIRSREMLKNSFSGNQQQEQRKQKLQMTSPDEQLLDRIMRVVNKNLANPDLNVQMLADTVGISRVHLHRKLKELTNQSTRDFIRNIRLQQAAALLADKKQNISEVAVQTGFPNVTYFSTAFKELYGMTPTAYRDRNNGQLTIDN